MKLKSEVNNRSVAPLSVVEGRSAAGAPQAPSRRVGVPLTAAIIAIALAGCSASLPGIRNNAAFPGNAAALAQRAAKTPMSLLYASTGRQNQIQIYAAVKPHHLVGEITDGLRGPNGLAVDAAGNLYVANVDAPDLTVYAPGGTSPIRTYKQGLNNPLTPAIGSDGTLYVSNFNSDGSGEIYEFKPGHLKPSFTIPLPNGGAVGLAVDAANNVYATTYGGTGNIVKFPPKSKQGKDLGITLSFAGRLIVDHKGNLIVCDQGVPAVDVFPPGATKPSKQITTGFGDPFALALNHDSTRLYVADGSGNTVNVYSYPKLTPLGVVNRGSPTYGIAIYPPAAL